MRISDWSSDVCSSDLSEADRLADLALRVEHSQPAVASMLLAEIDRAEIHTAETLPANTVAMNSHVTFVDEGSGSRREVQLVYPENADIAKDRTSTRLNSSN